MLVVTKMIGCYLVAVFVLAFPSAYGDMPQVHKVSSAFWLFQDQSLSLSCKATNVNDSYSIVWYDRDNENKLYVNTTTGDHLISNTRSGSTLTSTLTLFNARKFTAYKKITMYCELRYNKTDKIEGSTDYSESFFFRTFQSKDWPNVTVTPKKVAVDYGAPVKMLCNVRGNLQITKLDVMWIKGRDVLNSTSQSAVGAPVDYAFNLRKTNGSSGGLYMCNASKDVHGFFQDNDTTLVEVYPKLIGSSNKTIYHTVGENVTLSCDIDGYPLGIAWQKISSKKRNISAGGRYTIGNNGRTLIIAAFQLEDVGEFSCTNKDKNNRDIVQRFRLIQRVFPKPGSFDPEKTVTIIPGRPFTFKCEIEAVPLCVNWSTYNPASGKKESLRNIPGILLPSLCSRTWLVTNVSELEDGRVVSCFFRGVSQNFSVLKMTQPRRKGPERKEVKVDAGDDVTLTCDIIVKPLVITWLVDDDKLLTVKNKRYLINRENPRLLMIKDVHYDDRRSFVCSAKNALDEEGVKQEIRLRVKDPLGALWPAIGIIAVVVVVALIIAIAVYLKRKQQRDEPCREYHDGDEHDNFEIEHDPEHHLMARKQ